MADPWQRLKPWLYFVRNAALIAGGLTVFGHCLAGELDAPEQGLAVTIVFLIVGAVVGTIGLFSTWRGARRSKIGYPTALEPDADRNTRLPSRTRRRDTAWLLKNPPGWPRHDPSDRSTS